MKPINDQQPTPRREFLGALTTGVATLSVASLVNPQPAAAKAEPLSEASAGSADAWFNSIKGKHKVVFDATRPHSLYPFAWPRVFLMTNGLTGTPESDNSVVVVLRHEAIPYAFENRLWEKYKFGEVFKADDPATGKPADRNPFAKPKSGDFKFPGVGDVAIGINELQASGVKFCVCEMAMTVYSSALAQGMNMKPEDVRKDWMAGLLPGIQPVPSGVWALGRAQEKGCAYIFAG
jgi:intracellular sulfur oxidation DsrE/DsrF family protein